MKLLHILKSEPDQTARTLMEILSRGNETSTFTLEGSPDYEELIDQIFAHDKVITWW